MNFRFKSRSESGANLVLRTAVGLTLVVSLYGCSGEQQDEAKIDDSALASKALLEDGFYGGTDVEPDASEHDSDADDASSVQDESTQELASNDALVENFGFSTLDDAPPETEVSDPQPDCGTAIDPSVVHSSKSICKAISDRLASISMNDCETAKLETGLCNSVGQFPILVREFAPFEERAPQGRILVIGGTHGDELTSVSIVFRWIEKLNRFHSGLFHWRVVPMLNPDGVMNREASRTNQNGVDLNRNMPSDDWDENALKYWTEKSGKNARRYPGPHAGSEPETQWLINEIKTFKPDAIISVHAPYGVVDYDSLILNTAPKSLGKLALNLLGTYPGSLGNYAGINKNIPVITLELPHAWVMPSDKESTKIWEDIVRWLRKNVNSENVALQGY